MRSGDSVGLPAVPTGKCTRETSPPPSAQRDPNYSLSTTCVLAESEAVPAPRALSQLQREGCVWREVGAFPRGGGVPPTTLLMRLRTKEDGGGAAEEAWFYGRCAVGVL